MKDGSGDCPKERGRRRVADVDDARNDREDALRRLKMILPPLLGEIDGTTQLGWLASQPKSVSAIDDSIFTGESYDVRGSESLVLSLSTSLFIAWTVFRRSSSSSLGGRGDNVV